MSVPCMFAEWGSKCLKDSVWLTSGLPLNVSLIFTVAPDTSTGVSKYSLLTKYGTKMTVPPGCHFTLCACKFPLNIERVGTLYRGVATAMDGDWSSGTAVLPLRPLKGRSRPEGLGMGRLTDGVGRYIRVAGNEIVSRKPASSERALCEQKESIHRGVR